MKINIFLITALTQVIWYSCEKSESIPLKYTTDSLFFKGTFKTNVSDSALGNVNLLICQNRYECTTNLPFGIGAGDLITDKSTIEFKDTLFFPIPALYGVSYVLSGKYEYIFNGKNMALWKEFGNENITYNLELIEKKK